MSKQNDLKLVFDFIANYLRENEEKEVIQDKPISRITGEPLVTKPHIVEDDVQEDKPMSSLRSSVNRGLEIMKRLDDIDKAKANAVRMLKFDETVRNSLNKQLQDLRTEHAMMLSEDTIAEEKANTPTGVEPIQETNLVSVQDNEVIENLTESIVTTATTISSVFSNEEPKKVVKKKKVPVKRKTKK